MYDFNKEFGKCLEATFQEPYNLLKPEVMAIILASVFYIRLKEIILK